MAIPGLGMLAGLALRFPTPAGAVIAAGGFIKKHWKSIAIIVVALCACVSAYTYVKHVEKVSYASGFGAAQSQAKAAVDKANAVAANDQHQLDLMKQKYTTLSNDRQIQVVTVTKPIIERVTHEVQSAPVYRDCVLTDSVFHDLQTEAAGVNASIDSASH